MFHEECCCMDCQGIAHTHTAFESDLCTQQQDLLCPSVLALWWVVTTIYLSGLQLSVVVFDAGLLGSPLRDG